jgi:hypothetical protein
MRRPLAQYPPVALKVKTEILMAAGKISQAHFTPGEALFGFSNSSQPALDDVFKRNQIRITIQKTLHGYIELPIFA